jgi:hypothetical protein
MNNGLAVRIDQPHSDGVPDKPCRLMDIQTRHQLRSVRLDGLDANADARRDLLRRIALGDQLENLALTGR